MNNRIRMISIAAISVFALTLFSGCSGSSDSSSGGGGGGTTPDTPQTERLRMTNGCDYTIWIQQEEMPATTASVVEIASGSSYDYVIPAAGQPSTRFWVKKGCDADGQNCAWGQNSDPCPAAGCAPPVDSKIESTWGCTLSDQSQCNSTSQGDLITDTYFDTSAVDGYTLPYTVTVSGNTLSDDTQPCQDLDCSTLSLNNCPTSENLSQGQTETHAAYSSEDLRLYNPDDSTTVVGCYSPCKKLNYTATWGGEGLNEDSDAVVMYCCPTPPISTEECRAGPVVNTEYVAYIHDACTGGVYAYAYDDLNGLHKCSAATLIHMTFGPNCP